MRTLLVEVQQLPDGRMLPPLALSAYPQLLQDDMQLWRRIPVHQCLDLYGAVELYAPAVIVYLGPQALAEAWRGVSEGLFPSLFAMAHPTEETEKVLDAVFQRTSLLRRQRLAQRAFQQPNIEAVVWSELETRLPKVSSEALKTWIERFALSPLLERMDTEAFARGLLCLALLSTQVPLSRPCSAWLDIGSHLWSYAPFLRAFQGLDGALTGIELDPWYLQEDGLSRADWAQYYADIAQASYLAGDPSELDLPQQDLITLFLPLVLQDNALRWGLPARRHHPAALLARTRELLKPGGQMLIYNGVEVEYRATLSLLEGLKWSPIEQGRYFCPLRQQPQGYVIRLGP